MTSLRGGAGVEAGGVVKLIVDGNLGKLARWLRALGCDTVCHEGRADRFLLRRAYLEERIVVTKSRTLAARPFRGRLVLITADRWEEQLVEAVAALGLSFDALAVLGRCLECNEVLSDVEKGAVEGLVPPYILETQPGFRRCGRCGRVYWAGSHAERMLRVMRSRIPSRPP
jgi:hypothetical protein